MSDRVSKWMSGCAGCGGRLVLQRLFCPDCDCTVEGEFVLPLLARLPRDQQEFIERFILANGSLKRLAQDMSCSYPKVRNRLDRVMHAIREEHVAVERRKEEILELLESGKLSGRDAASILRSLL